MTTKTKSCIRAVVVCAIVAWPTIETYRLWVTSRQMEEALALERTVQAKLEVARAKQVQVAKAAPSGAAAKSPDAKP